MARGGKRDGAGRPPGSKDKATRDAGATIGELARDKTDIALKALEEVANDPEQGAARVSAANSLLDRGYGKPAQSVEHSGKDGGAIEIQNTDIKATVAAVVSLMREASLKG